MTRSVIRSKVVSKESVVVAGSLALRYVPQEIIGTQEFGVFEIYLIPDMISRKNVNEIFLRFLLKLP